MLNCFLQFRPKSILRNWLRKTGKGAYIEFDEKQMEILSECFKDLDEDGSQAIGVEELIDPLIALGLVDTRDQVEEMVAAIDEDAQIEFDEFLQLVKGGKKTAQKMAATLETNETESTDVIYDFFQELTKGNMNPDKNMKIGFGIYYSSKRREKILDAIFDVTDVTKKREGKRILDNYRMQLSDQMKRIKENRQQMKETG